MAATRPEDIALEQIEQGVSQPDHEKQQVRSERLDENLSASTSNQLDSDVVAMHQIRAVIKTFQDKLPTEKFPLSSAAPKTPIKTYA